MKDWIKVLEVITVSYALLMILIALIKLFFDNTNWKSFFIGFLIAYGCCLLSLPIAALTIKICGF